MMRRGFLGLLAAPLALLVKPAEAEGPPADYYRIPRIPGPLGIGNVVRRKVVIGPVDSLDNPKDDNYVADYICFYADHNTRQVWPRNVVVGANQGVTAELWGDEVDVNNSSGVDAPEPRTPNHHLAYDAVSGGTNRPSSPFNVSSTTLGNRWRFGFWADHIGGILGSALHKTGLAVDVDYGLMWLSANIAKAAVYLRSGTPGLVYRHGDREITALTLDEFGQLIIGDGLASHCLYLNVDGVVRPVTLGAPNSGGLGGRVLRVPN